MERKRITVEEFEAYCKENGIPMTPDDDPVYDEGPTIVFLHRKKNENDDAGKESNSVNREEEK